MRKGLSRVRALLPIPVVLALAVLTIGGAIPPAAALASEGRLAPTPVPAPTDPPPPAPEATATAPASLGALLAGSVFAEGLGGPYSVETPFWACYDVSNTHSDALHYSALGIAVQETGDLYASRVDATLLPNEPLAWCEYIVLEEPGTYHLWLRMCIGETCDDAAKPLAVIVEE